MKKLLAITIMALAVMMAAPAAYAQSSDSIKSYEGVENVIGPGHPLYQVDIVLDNIRTNLNPQAGIEVAHERTKEMKKAAEEGNQPGVEQASESRDNAIAAAATSENVEPGDIQSALDRHVEVLEAVKEKVPEVAKDAIDNAISNSQKASEAAKEAQEDKGESQADKGRSDIVNGIRGR